MKFSGFMALGFQGLRIFSNFGVSGFWGFRVSRAVGFPKQIQILGLQGFRALRFGALGF